MNKEIDELKNSVKHLKRYKEDLKEDGLETIVPKVEKLIRQKEMRIRVLEGREQ